MNIVLYRSATRMIEGRDTERFLSNSHFSRVFKKVVNVSPLDYKRSLRVD